MAAYDLRVQKPSSLSVPKGPGAADLARFLSVSEATRANTQREQIQRDTLDWEKGAGDRALAAAEQERERVRQENMARGRAATEGVSNYLSTAQEEFRLHEDTLRQFDEMFPEATPEQRDGIRQKVRGQITQTPGAYVDQKKMGYDLENMLVNKHGWGRAEAQAEAARQISAHFAPKGGINDKVLGGFVDVIKDSGVTDTLTDYYPQSSGKGSSGSGGDGGDYRDAAKFVKKYQRDDEGNNFAPGSKRWWNFNYPWEGDKIYTDTLTSISTEAQADYGVKPQYVGAILESLSENGRLPTHLSENDLKDPKSELYGEVIRNAAKLQNEAEGSGPNGSNRRVLTPEQIRASKQGDLDTQFKALNELNAVLQSSGGRPLNQQEQLQLLTQPDLLEEFGLALSESVQQQPENRTAAPPASRRSTEPAAETLPDTGTDPVDEGDNQDLTDLIEGSGDTAQPDQTVALPATGNPETPRSAPQQYRDMQQNFAEQLGFNRDIVEEEDVLSGMTLKDLRDEIPAGADRRRAYELFTDIRSGNGTDKKVNELMSMLSASLK